MHLDIFAPLMAPLKHIITKVENTAAKIWAHRGIVRSASDIGPLLREYAWIFCQTQTHASVVCVAVTENHEADAASWLTHLPVLQFTRHFNTAFPQQYPWWMRLLLCVAKHHMLTMLHKNRLLQDCTLPL